MLTQKKKLTVAIPTYNRREYLHECLESLDRQTYKNFQVIIFDNASDYNVNEFVSLFPKLDIEIEKNEKNIGSQPNLTKILKFDFNSQYVIVFHDDDTLHPRYFEFAIDFLDAHPHVVWAGSNINFVWNKNGSEMKKFDVSETKDSFIELSQRELVKKIMEGFNLGFGTIIYQSKILKSALLRNGVFEKWADRPLLVDLAQDQKVAVTPVKFMNYRMHEQKESHNRKSTDLGYLINLFNYYRGKSDEKDTKAFKVLETDNSINTATGISTTFKELRESLKALENEGLFSLKYIRLKGIYYFLRFAARKLI